MNITVQRMPLVAVRTLRLVKESGGTYKGKRDLERRVGASRSEINNPVDWLSGLGLLLTPRGAITITAAGVAALDAFDAWYAQQPATLMHMERAL